MARDRWFAATWDWQAHHERKRLKRLRREVVGAVHGRVLEVGVGVGSNWPYLAGGVEYVGLEPNEAMLERALKHARRRAGPWTSGPSTCRRCRSQTTRSTP